MKCRLAAPLAGLLLWALAAFAQTTPRLVHVDAVVTDSAGNPVPNLTAADFEILQDGKPRKIASFTYFDTRRHTAFVGDAVSPALALDLKPDEIRRNLAARRRRLSEVNCCHAPMPELVRRITAWSPGRMSWSTKFPSVRRSVLPASSASPKSSTSRTSGCLNSRVGHSPESRLSRCRRRAGAVRSIGAVTP